MLFTEVPFLDRFARAAQAGFRGVEFLFPYAYPAAEIARRARDAGVEIVLFNLPPGDFDRGERGIAALPRREDEFRRSVALALDYAEILQTKRLHVMAGLASQGACDDIYRANLGYAAGEAAGRGVTLLIEPINARDMPGYHLARQEHALATLAAVNADNLRLQCDLYHLQISAGDIMCTLQRDLALIGHIQIAGVPDRNEPDRGELAYPAIFALLDRLGYPGWVGCEYRPRGATEAGLGWFEGYRD